MLETDREILKEFLEMPLWTSDPVFEKFRYHLKTIFREDRNNPKQRFLYIEGIRKEKVVLVAHADTFRDFIKRKNGYTEPDKNRRTDIVNLCRKLPALFSVSVTMMSIQPVNESISANGKVH